MSRRRTFSTCGWKKYLDYPNNPRLKSFFESRGTDVLTQITGNINRQISANGSELRVVIHPNVGSIMIIPRKDFESVLNIALNWFISKENYEMCHTINQYKNKLKNKSSKKQREDILQKLL